MLDLDEVNIKVCQELTTLKLELLKDYDVNYRPGYRVVLEENLQGARDYALKQYKVCRKEVENKDLDSAIDYLKQKSVEFDNQAKEYKSEQTDDYDYPLREYWGQVGSKVAIDTLIKQITDGDIKVL